MSGNRTNPIRREWLAGLLFLLPFLFLFTTLRKDPDGVALLFAIHTYGVPRTAGLWGYRQGRPTAPREKALLSHDFPEGAQLLLPFGGLLELRKPDYEEKSR